MEENDHGAWLIEHASTIILLVLIAIVAIGQQFVTLDKLHGLPPSAGFKSPGEFLGELRTVGFDGWDAALLALLGGALAVLIGLEFRHRRLTAFLDYCCAHDGRVLLLVIAGSAVLVRYYLSRGQLSWAGDAAEHIVYASIVADALAAGEWSIWSNWFSAGSPFLQFYGFLFFYCVAVVDLLVGEIFTSLKVVLMTAHVVSGATAYAWLRMALGSRRAALLGALAYVLSFWHTQQVLFMGRLPLSLFYAVLPIPFFFFETIKIWRKREWAMGLGAASLGLLVFIHPGYGFWAGFFLVVYVVLKCFLLERACRRSLLAWGGGLILLGTTFGSTTGLPMLLEAHQTSLASGISLSGVPDPSWQHLLGWSNFRTRLIPLSEANHHWYGGYLGLSLLFISIVGAVVAYRKGHHLAPLIPGAVGFILVMLIIFGYRLSILQDLPPVTALNSGRYLLFAVFFLAYLVAAAILTIERTVASKRAASRIFTVLIALVILDLGPTTFQHPYMPRDAIPINFPPWSLRQIQHEQLDNGRLPDFRTFATTDYNNPFQTIGWLGFASGIPTSQALYNETPLAYRDLIQPWATFSEPIFNTISHAKELLDNPAIDIISGGLVLLNIHRVIALQKNQLLTFEWKVSTPVLVSPRTTAFPYDDFDRMHSQGQIAAMLRRTFPHVPDPIELTDIFKSLWLIRAYGIDAPRARCEQIILRSPHHIEDIGTDPDVVLLKHHVWNQRMEMDLELSAPAYVRLAYAYYPELRIHVNGKRLEALETAGGFVALKLPAGRSEIVLIPRLSLLRRTLWYTNTLALVLVPAAIALLKRKKSARIV